MTCKYKHGGGYKQAANNLNLNWEEVIDFSTSVNWIASNFYPVNTLYEHILNIPYPEINYFELKDKIEKFHNFKKEHFILTNGANEAISGLFYLFNILNFNNEKTIILTGPTYSEYNKYTDLNNFNVIKQDYKDITNHLEFKNKIFIIVNPNTPFGEYNDINNSIDTILTNGGIVVIDESFIDFTNKKSIYSQFNNAKNLFIIHSMTKFYGAAGARLGIIINTNPKYLDLLDNIIPPWSISTYTNWFYNTMIPQYNEIKESTLQWIKTSKQLITSTILDSKNLSLTADSITNYQTLNISQDYIDSNNINDIQEYFLVKYKIYIRPTSDFYGCKLNSFRVGYKDSQANQILARAIKDIG